MGFHPCKIGTLKRRGVETLFITPVEQDLTTIEPNAPRSGESYGEAMHPTFVAQWIGSRGTANEEDSGGKGLRTLGDEIRTRVSASNIWIWKYTSPLRIAPRDAGERMDQKSQRGQGSQQPLSPPVVKSSRSIFSPLRIDLPFDAISLPWYPFYVCIKRHPLLQSSSVVASSPS